MRIKFLFYIILINLIIFTSIELGVKFTLKYLGYSTHQTYGNLDSHRYNFLTGYYKDPFEEELIKRNGKIKLGSDRYGFSIDGIHTKDRIFTEKENCTFRTFILGGSTVEGRHLVDRFDTISARLEARLRNNFNNPNINFEVINTGVSSFQTSQELALYLYKILYGFKPDHVIFFNGSNYFTNAIEKVNFELTNSHVFQREFEKAFKKSSTNVFYFIDRIFSENLSTYFLSKKIIQKMIINAKKERNDQSVSLENMVSKHVYRYFYNINLLSLTASSETNVSVFFQPTLLPELKNKLSKKERNFMQDKEKISWNNYPFFEAKQLYYDLTRKKIDSINKDKKFNNEMFQIIDLSKIFNDKEKTKNYYSDHVHYLPFSRSIIVKNMELYLYPKIKNSLKNKYKECL